MARTEQSQVERKEIEHIPDILSFFSIGKMSTCKKLDGGTANLNYVVTTQRDEEFIVKFAKNQIQESLVNDREIAAQLKRAGICSPDYLESPDGRFIYNEGLIAVMWPRIDGVHPKPIDANVSYAIGDVLARFHGAVTTLPNHREAWLNPSTTKKPISREEDELTKHARRFLAEGKQIYESSLPSGIIHGDLDQHNLLVSNGDQRQIIALLDFEETEKNLLNVDIARTIVRLCATDLGTKLDKSLIQEFIKGYSSVRQLSRDELNNLPNAIKWVTGAAMLWYIENDYPEDARNAISRVESIL